MPLFFFFLIFLSLSPPLQAVFTPVKEDSDNLSSSASLLWSRPAMISFRKEKNVSVFTLSRRRWRWWLLCAFISPTSMSCLCALKSPTHWEDGVNKSHGFNSNWGREGILFAQFLFVFLRFYFVLFFFLASFQINSVQMFTSSLNASISCAVFSPFARTHRWGEKRVN